MTKKPNTDNFGPVKTHGDQFREKLQKQISLVPVGSPEPKTAEDNFGDSLFLTEVPRSNGAVTVPQTVSSSHNSFEGHQSKAVSLGDPRNHVQLSEAVSSSNQSNHQDSSSKQRVPSLQGQAVSLNDRQNDRGQVVSAVNQRIRSHQRPPVQRVKGVSSSFQKPPVQRVEGVSSNDQRSPVQRVEGISSSVQTPQSAQQNQHLQAVREDFSPSQPYNTHWLPVFSPSEKMPSKKRIYLRK